MDGFKQVFSSLYNGSNGEDQNMARQFNNSSLYNSSSFCGSSNEGPGNCGSQNGASADSQIVS